MQLSGVRLSVRCGSGAAALTQPGSTGPQHGAQQQMRAVPRLQPRDAAEHRLVGGVA